MEIHLLLGINGDGLFDYYNWIFFITEFFIGIGTTIYLIAKLILYVFKKMRNK